MPGKSMVGVGESRHSKPGGRTGPLKGHYPLPSKRHFRPESRLEGRHLPIEAFVYFIHAPRYHVVKIGVATDPVERFGTLQSANFADLEIATLIRSRDAYALESRIHEKWEQYRLRGEWFSVKYEETILPKFEYGYEDDDGQVYER